MFKFVLGESFLKKIEKDDDAETADIFETAMQNNFAVGSVIIENILGKK